MTKTDPNHRIAAIIKDLEERIANLEEQDRSTSTPNLLRTQRASVVVNDGQTTTTTHSLSAATYQQINETGGWGTSTWGSYR